MMAEIARAYRACKAQALDRVVAQINSPMVRVAEAKR
jgi:hypothetical protein